MKARIDIRIKRVSLGNFSDVEPGGKGVSEQKNTLWCWIPSIFYYPRKIIIILLCGGDKSTQSKDIQNAHDLAIELKEYLK